MYTPVIVVDPFFS